MILLHRGTECLCKYLRCTMGCWGIIYWCPQPLRHLPVGDLTPISVDANLTLFPVVVTGPLELVGYVVTGPLELVGYVDAAHATDLKT